MKPILVLYATREGQTRRIAEHIGSVLRGRGFDADVRNAAALPPDFSLARYDGTLLAASVHVGKHEPEMVAFVKTHRAALEEMRTAFLSVSGAEVSAEDTTTAPALREKSAAEVSHTIDAFLQATGWHPERVFPVAGALMFLDYNPLVRFVIRVIARRGGVHIDTTRNTEYTNWESLDHFVADWTAEGAGVAPVPSTVGAGEPPPG
jgi:menaquinone-dependent protoporphyrinogen oxidase